MAWIHHQSKKRLSILLVSLIVLTGFILMAIATPSGLVSVAEWAGARYVSRPHPGISLPDAISEYCQWPASQHHYIERIFDRLQVDLRKYSNMNEQQKLLMLADCKNSQGVCTAISIHNGEVFIKQLGTAVFTRHLHILQLFRRVAKKFFPLPDCDLVFETSDGGPDTKGLPRFMLGVIRAAPQGIMIPDETFYDFPEAICPGETSHKWSDFLVNATQRYERMKNEDLYQVISEKKNEIFWRGARLAHPIRIQQLDKIISSASSGNRTLFNIEPMQWIANSATGNNAAQGCVPLNDHCKYRFLLHLRGITYSSRLKYLLLCGSIVFMPEQEYDEWWYPAFPAYEESTPDNEIIIETKDDISNFHDRFAEMYTCQDPSERILATSMRTIEFALAVFSEKTVDCYLGSLIHGAAKSWGPILSNRTGRTIDSILDSTSLVVAFSDL